MSFLQYQYSTRKETTVGRKETISLCAYSRRPSLWTCCWRCPLLRERDSNFMQPGSRALICTEKPTSLQEGQNFKPTFLWRSDTFGSPLPPPSLYTSLLIVSFVNVLDSVTSVNSVKCRSSIPVKPPPHHPTSCWLPVHGCWALDRVTLP